MPQLRRPIILLVSSLLSVVMVVSAPGAAQAARQDTSADWLAGQLTDGVLHNAQYGFDDYALTADAAFALAEIGGQDAALTAINDALAAHVNDWTTSTADGRTDVYAGSVAKALVLAEVTGADPRNFGGVNLVARLKHRVMQTSPNLGRIRDRAGADYANVVGQALAARGLSAAGWPGAPDVVRFLLRQQCSAGYFRLNFAPRTAARQSCDAGDPRSTSVPDTDATALAVLSLQAIENPSTRVQTAIADAVRWLKRHQKDNGSFGGGPTTAASNANSTGLAAWALGQAHACAAAADAARWVKRLQAFGDLSGTGLLGSEGAIAYDRAAYAAGLDRGIRKATRDQWRRTTAQAAPGLAYLSTTDCLAG